MRYSQQQQGLPPWKKVWHLHLTNICMVGVFMLKRMYGGVLLASLIPCLAVAADNASVQLILSSATHSDNVNVAPDSFVAVVLDSPRRANFKHEKASSKVMSMADWVLTSGDHQHKPFLIVDKVHAKVFVFDVDGSLRGASRALLGMAYGDETVPGIGDRAISAIRPKERTTSAGRFIAALGRDARGEEILWVDYDAGIALHRVITTNPTERRLQRLATATSVDKRISYGCINVPVSFYDNVVHPVFTGTDGIVYVLPEIKTMRETFASYGVVEQKEMILHKTISNVKKE
ncbi:hypothetical protein [Undibacterium sp. RuRC25W]|uniref:hypothetical protein n=1 Tax=Undibacterium sp. RuRC25W TaxID=3413047 RepID=UPI003BF11D6E